MAKKIPEPNAIQTDTAPAAAETTHDPAAVKVPAEIPAGIKPEMDQTCPAGFYCYIGPTIKGLIQTGTVYCGSRNDARRAAAKAIQKFPGIKALIVPGDNLPDALRKINDPGSGLYSRFQQLAGNA